MFIKNVYLLRNKQHKTEDKMQETDINIHNLLCI